MTTQIHPEEAQVLALIHMEILTLSPDKQQKVTNTAAALREFVRANGPEAYMALALVGAEMAATGIV